MTLECSDQIAYDHLDVEIHSLQHRMTTVEVKINKELRKNINFISDELHNLRNDYRTQHLNFLALKKELIEMAKLTTKTRKALPKKAFAEPGKRAYPIENKAHARNALARVTQSENKGNISASEANKVRAKARKVLKSPKKK